MPEDLGEDDRQLSAKIHVVKDKTDAIKKGLTKKKECPGLKKEGVHGAAPRSTKGHGGSPR